MCGPNKNVRMRKNNSTNSINKISLEQDCGMAFTIAKIGGRWKLSILGLLHDEGVLRYSEIKTKSPGISERMLTLQLKELEKEGLISKAIYAEVPARVEYQLSTKGKSLSPIFYEMTKWGEEERGDNR
jgi:DNA-binding HxlR family transcriptional regulator